MGLTITPVHGCTDTYTVSNDWHDFLDAGGHLERDPVWMTLGEAQEVCARLGIEPRMLADVTAETPTPAPSSISPLTVMRNRSARLERDAQLALRPACTSESGRPTRVRGRISSKAGA